LKSVTIVVNIIMDMANESLNDTINKSLLTLEREAHKKKYH
jgi:hypothetical protein